MKRVLVLGAGRVGSVMALDLAASGLAVTAVDARAEALAPLAARGVATRAAALGDPAAVQAAAADQDLVVNALSSAIGKQTLRALLEAGRRVVDISFMAETPLDLDGLAKARGACAVVDMGVGPGVTNMLAARAAALLDPCRSIRIYVGGVPEVRRWPFEYKVAFAPSDVIEEYVRPSRVVEHGRLVEREALGNVELVDVDGVGTLEAFDTDGLRTLTETLRVPNLVEKTLRWPGHAALMRVLRAAGFFDPRPRDVGGVTVAPLDVTSALLFPAWSYEEGEVDLTVSLVVAEGERAGRPTRLVWEMVDRGDVAAGVRSMARTTGYPATAMARLLLEGRFTEPGVHPPEVPAARPGVLEAVLEALAARGIQYRFREEPLG